MQTETNVQENQQNKPLAQQDGHVHGPHCNHHHHHHDLLKPIKRELPKLGRNDLCLCGSQKKYKKCCGA